MRLFPEPITFEWDEGNSNKNLALHNVTNQEAEEIFFNMQNFMFEDTKHSLAEKRYMIWGLTNQERKLTIFFTIRKGKIRVISARDMHKKERRKYEKIKNTSEI